MRLNRLKRLVFVIALVVTGCLSRQPGLQSSCGADEWAVVPTRLISSPGAVGFKIIYITLAIENNSLYWGQIDTSSGDPIRDSYVTTEGGQEYPAAKQLKIVTNSPYAGQVNNWWLVNSQLYTQSLSSLPPGFAMHGETMISFDPVESGYGPPNTWSQAVYEVAENQNHFVLTIPSLSISCIHPNNQWFQETTGPIKINIDKDIRQPAYPTSRPDSDFISINDPITVPEGLLEFQAIHFEAGMAGFKYLVIDFKFTKAKSDTGNFIAAHAILLGDDGLTRRLTHVYGPPGCSSENSFAANPGESVDVKLCYLAGNDAASFKFLWIDEENSILKVYNLPEGF